MYLAATTLKCLQYIITRYAMWVTTIYYALVHFYTTSPTHYFLDIVQDVNFILAFVFTLILAFITDYTRGSLQVRLKELQKAYQDRNISHHGNESLKKEVTKANELARLGEADLENMKREIEEGTRKLRESVNDRTKMRKDRKELLKQLSAAKQGRLVADGLHRKRINDTRVAHYISLVQRQTGLINVLEKLVKDFKEVPIPKFDGASQVELHRNIFIAPVEKLSQRLCDSRLRTKNRLDIVKGVQNVLDLETLTPEEVDSLANKAEEDLERAANADGYLVVTDETVGTAVTANGSAATMEEKFEPRLGEHRDKLISFCKDSQDMGRVEGTEGEWDIDEEEGDVAI